MNDPEKTRRIELIGGVLLIVATVAALVSANSPWAAQYDRLLDVPFEVRLGEYSLAKPILLWINDGLMAIFFLVAGLELKREVLDGALESREVMTLPAVAAVGGVIVPIAIYLAINAGAGVRAEGWAIPAATDIAFALGVLALLGDRVKPELRTLLLSIAILDDIIAVLIIAVYYTEKISWSAKGAAIGMLALLVLLNRLRIRRWGVFLVLGTVLWVCVLKSGVHATLAGFVLGITIPSGPKTELGHAPLHELEVMLRPWVAYVVLPVFAFVNAGVALDGLRLETLGHTITLGVGLGLAIGKPLGIFGAIALALWLGIAKRPAGSTYREILAISVLGGIGFTMSLFIGVLAFEDTPRDFAMPIRIGVLGGSCVCALAGAALLLKRPKRDSG